jgi:hypothetical protein
MASLSNIEGSDECFIFMNEDTVSSFFGGMLLSESICFSDGAQRLCDKFTK